MPVALVSSSVPAQINFLDPKLAEKPYSWLGAPPAGRASTNIESFPCDVEIQDLRAIEDYKESFSVDTSGFQIVDLESAVEDFDTNEGRQAYFKEIETLLLSTLPKATRVHVFNHTIRRMKHNAVAASKERTPANTGPVARAHNDNTPATGARRVMLEMGDEAEELSKGRCQIINVWKPLAHAAQDSPLAYMDYRSLDKSDLVPTDLILSNEGSRKGENYSVYHNQGQRWYYLSDQTPSEAVVFKIYDSLNDPGVSQLTPHSSFVNPLAPADCPARESIEIRALVFY